ncbi:MAG TPA: FAD-dependent oxidoreductase, partial [Acidobacteriota bacterium]|nr:FAD-dependent oxidoreductase [Acidobacteriota bacterium]
MLETIRKNARKLLEDGFDGVIGLRKRWGHVGPYLFTNPEELEELEIEPKSPLSGIICALQSRWPDKKWAAVVRGCDERALKELEKRGKCKREELSFIGVACSQEQAEECNCEKPIYTTTTCTGCWKCIEECEKAAIERINVCPILIPSEYNLGLTQRKAIYVPYAQAVPLKYTRDSEHCLKIRDKLDCKGCLNICEAKAVMTEDQPKEETVEVGSIVVTAGAELFDANKAYDLGYGRFPNVLTSLEFERILSASGPTFGHLLRPSDRKEPKSIAWLQCVGSRDTAHFAKGYCSAVCCMYAVKDAMVAKEHSKEPLDAAIFFMDMRTFGKDFEKYYDRARDDHGVRFVKTRIPAVQPVPGSDDLLLTYSDEAGGLHKEVFDMVVLSVGLQVSESTVDLAKRLGITLDKYNFAATNPFTPVSTSRPGIYACGTFQGPKDIPSSITEASAAAGVAGMALSEARWTDTKTLEIPEELDVSEEEPRIGVFVCNCGINIGGVVDVPAVTEYAATLPHVFFTEENLFTCAQDTQDKIKEVIREQKLNRVVVASCTPRTHEPLFQDTLQACGLNKYLFEMANIRDQDSWVHSSDPATATIKAKDLIRMAVARAGLLKPLKEKRIPINRRALVIGGGVAGMNAALGLAKQGFESIIVEKEEELGGLSRQLTTTIEGAEIRTYVRELIEEVEKNDKIQVLTNALIVGFSGFQGNFTTEVIVGPAMYERKIE